MTMLTALRRTNSKTILGLALLAAALPWLTRPTTSAEASHPHPLSDGEHTYFVHWASSGHGAFDEDYCVQSYTTALTTDAVKTKIYSLIYNTGWDGTGSGKIDNWPLPYSCESYLPADISWIEYRISVVDNASAYGCGTVSCVDFYYPVYEGGTVKHWRQGGVWLRTDHINPLTSESANATINHEMGHVFGLLDGGSPQCLTSVMHQFGYCGYGPGGPYQQWVQTVDKNSVVNNIMPMH